MRQKLLFFSLALFLILAVPALVQAGCCKSTWRCGGAKGALPDFHGDYFVPATDVSQCTTADNQLQGVLATRVKELNEALVSNRCTCAIVTKAVYDGAVSCNQSSITPYLSMVSTSGDKDDKCGVAKGADGGSTDGSPSVGKSDRSVYKELPNPLGPEGATIGDLPKVIGKVINALMGVIGAIALLVFVYGGFVWMTAAGNETKIAQGKKILLWASIALIIIILGWILVAFLMEALGV